MKARNHWRSRKTRPLLKGWYQVKLPDGTTDWRAWGNGAWWKQLKDGWIAWFNGDGEPHEFQWRGPRKDIALDYADVVRAATPGVTISAARHEGQFRVTYPPGQLGPTA